MDSHWSIIPPGNGITLNCYHDVLCNVCNVCHVCNVCCYYDVLCMVVNNKLNCSFSGFFSRYSMFFQDWRGVDPVLNDSTARRSMAVPGAPAVLSWTSWTRVLRWKNLRISHVFRPPRATTPFFDAEPSTEKKKIPNLGVGFFIRKKSAWLMHQTVVKNYPLVN